MRFPPVQTDALSVYEKLWHYWNLKQAEVNERFSEMERTRKERKEAQDETLEYLYVSNESSRARGEGHSISYVDAPTGSGRYYRVTPNYRQKTRDKLQEIDRLRNEIQWFDEAGRHLYRECERLRLYFDDLEGRKVALEMAVEEQDPEGAKMELEIRLESLDEDITKLREEVK